jgi:uncharacterized protein YndB with AHSA1/START domain
MNFDDSVEIGAPAADVWRVFTDVERWPEWTASMRSVEIVRGSGVEQGARVRIRQPRLPVMTWEVSEVEPGVSWSWVARSPGVVTVARHRVSATDAGGARVEQAIEQRGPLAGIAGLLTGRLTRRYLAIEGAGLKQRCEATART